MGSQTGFDFILALWSTLQSAAQVNGLGNNVQPATAHVPPNNLHLYYIKWVTTQLSLTTYLSLQFMRKAFNVPNIRYILHIFYRYQILKRQTMFFILIYLMPLSEQYDIALYWVLVPTGHRRQKYTENEFVLTKSNSVKWLKVERIFLLQLQMEHSSASILWRSLVWSTFNVSKVRPLTVWQTN